MITPSLPPNEGQRLSNLRDLNILDTGAEAGFDRLTRLASRLFNVPIALVSIIDENRQWFKSRQGLDTCETERDISFCGHTILGHEVMVVNDATLDSRFSDNPLVTGDLGIRFYAGAPLIDQDGCALGTLCIIDKKPRQLNKLEIETLRDIAELVMNEINNIKFRHKANELERRKKRSDLSARLMNLAVQSDFDVFRSSQYLLDQLLELTESVHGFAVGISLDNRIHALATTTAFDSSQSFFEKLIGLDKIVLSNNPRAEVAHLPDNDDIEHFSALLIIPILHEKKQLGVIGLAKSTGSYDSSHLDFLKPVIQLLVQLGINLELRLERSRDRKILARLSEVARQMPSGVVITDHERKIEWVNESFTRTTGYTLDEIKGQIPSNLLKGPETDRLVLNQIEAHLTRGESFEAELMSYTKSGSAYWNHLLCKPLIDANGVNSGYLTIETDVSEKKRSLDLLAERESLLRSLFELSPVGIALNDAKTGNYLEVNQAFTKSIQYSVDELKSLSYLDLTPKEYEPLEEVFLEKLKQHGRFGPYEKEYIRKDGTRYPVLLSAISLKDHKGRDLIWSIVEDISERKKIEKNQNDLISVISHELRTPLTSISGALQLISNSKDVEIPAKIIHLLEIAVKNTNKLSLLVSDILDISKLSAGELSINLQVHPIHHSLVSAVELNKALGQRKNVHIVLDSHVDGVEVLIDFHRLEQVLSNLISNAIKFSPHNSHINIDAEIVADRVKISVTDKGQGIPKSSHSQIFQKFFQVDPTDRRSTGGTGLGLSISRELIIRMNGHIGFDSQPGHGTTFWITLPVHHSD